MKKTLLLSLALVASVAPAMSEVKDPQVYEDASFQQITKDGRYLISSLLGVVSIYDLTTGDRVDYVPEELEYYSTGNGNFVSNNAEVIVGGVTEANSACYLENGVWYDLKVANPDYVNISNGITPDASRICGSIGLSAMSFDETLMQAPVYWDRNADGTYGDYVVLPHPTKDLFGEKPQYITALVITEDGKTIIGQMVFSSGTMAIPIVYTQDAKGEWSYSLPTKDLFNPNHLDFVENPGDGPTPPNAEDYLSPEGYAKYEAALEAYYNDTTWSTPYPEYKDFMSAEELADYNADMEEYKKKYAAWEEKYYAYWDFFEGVSASSPSFLFNSAIMSIDSKSFIMTLESEIPNPDPYAWMPLMAHTPCSFDIATGEMTKVETDLSIIPTCTANDGIILGFNGVGETPMTGYVIKDGQVQDIYDFIKSASPEFGQWLDDNMYHEVVVGLDDEWNEIYEELMFTGMPVATPDLSTIAIWNDCPWDSNIFAEGIVFQFGHSNGIGAISAADRDIKSVAAGVVSVPAGFESMQVYSINGQAIKSYDRPEGTIDLKLQAGVYIVTGVRVDGSKSVLKVVAD